MASAMIAPLSDDTIVIGTNDSGRTLHSESDAPKDTCDSIRALAKKLNLKRHAVESSCGNMHFMVSLAADVEIHRCNNRNILLDAARLIPPMTPRQKFDHLVKQFRPELILNLGNISRDITELPSQLSSDAYSKFSSARDVLQLNRDIDVVTKYVEKNVVKKVRVELERGSRKFWKSELISEFLHTRGLNLRYLGRLRGSIESSTPAMRQLREVLLNEIIARVMKNEVRNRMREKCCKREEKEEEKEEEEEEEEEEEKEMDPFKSLSKRIRFRCKKRRGHIKKLFLKMSKGQDSLERNEFFQALETSSLIWDHTHDDEIWHVFRNGSGVVTRKRFFSVLSDSFKFTNDAPRIKRTGSSKSSTGEEEEEEDENIPQTNAKKLIVSCLNLLTSSKRSFWWTSVKKGGIKRAVMDRFPGSLSEEEMNEKNSIAPTKISALIHRVSDLLCFELRVRKKSKKKKKMKKLKKTLRKLKNRKEKNLVVEYVKGDDEEENVEENVEKEWQKLSKSKVAIMIARYHQKDSPTTNKKKIKEEKKRENRTISSCFQFHQESDKVIGCTGKSKYRIKDVTLKPRIKAFFLESSISARVLRRSAEDLETSWRRKRVETPNLYFDHMLSLARDEYVRSSSVLIFHISIQDVT